MTLEPLTPEELVNELRRRWVTPASPIPLSAPPIPGSLARASWDDFTQVVLVTSASEVEVVGYPVELGRAEEATELTFLPAERTTLNVPLTAASQPRFLPAVLFDATIGRATSNHWERRKIRGVAPLNSTLQYTNHFADLDGFLAGWETRSQSRSVADVFAAAGVTVTQIKVVLGIPGPAAVKIRRGERHISADDAERLSVALQIPLSELLQADTSIPRGLQEALNRFKYRPVIERLRSTLGTLARAFDDLAAGALSAARADSSEGDWEHRIDRYIEGVGL
ncbi:helix-turn-helix transcriptional regulator [Leifsonia aquatica]|uniref:helix-turn-helix transcriptional regulator n=1 Tax=Leifsonia aquatica TaxID=144185 RepID=UPI0028A7A557|nr:helix-turn-helix transcriptional regulator [Leifsonia aquatica]